MKKALYVLTLSIVLVFALSAVALAANPHGNFTTNTSACATCHITHTAVTAKLVNFSSAYSSGIAPNPNTTYKMCVYCHSSGVAESKYDSVNGQIKDTTNLWASAGGGAEKDPKVEGAAVAIPASELTTSTSIHSVFAAAGTLVSMPGNNQNSAARVELWCSSCHDPHGTGNARQLKASFPRLLVDNVTTTNVTITLAANTIAVTNPLTNESVTYTNAMSDFCGACHYDYLATAAGSGSATSGYYDAAKYRHRVAKLGTTLAPTGYGYDAAKNILPMSTTGDITCMTCHVAHGTSSTVASGSSALLRMDERGVCQNCHNKTKDIVAPIFADRDTGTGGIQATWGGASSPRTVLVTFTNYVQATAAQTTANYSMTGAATMTIASAVLQPDGKTIMLTTTADITTVGTYTVRVTTTNILDTNGNATVANAPAATFVR